MIKILLFTLIIYIVIRFISLKKQIRTIETKLRNKERINIALTHKDIEILAETINNMLQKQKQLEIAITNREDKLKQDISHISHDLRTPLAAIRGYLTLLENCTDEEKIKYINVLQRKANELNMLLHNFYELSILDNTNYEIQTKAIDIVEIITDSVISNYTLIKERELELNNKLPCKPIEIQGEEIACRRIVQNLIFNAIKYSTGYISIELYEFNDEVLFTIRNSVLNLKENDLKYLFHRFYTVDKSRNGSGTGLGLYIVKILVEKIGGQINDISLKEDVLSISILFKSFIK